MHGLKKETDLSFLAGRELIQVAIGSFQVQFHFDGDVAVSVEAEFRYFDGQREWIWRQERSSPQVASRTVAMLGASVTRFESTENGTLALTFSNGHRLTMVTNQALDRRSFLIEKLLRLPSPHTHRETPWRDETIR